MRRLLAFVVVLGLSGLLLTSGARAAEARCGERVLADWFDNGRIDRVHPLACYEEAIATMPTDLRDYTDARDVIRRALASALRERPRAQSEVDQAARSQATADIDTSREGTLRLPLPLIALLSLALLLLGVGVVRRLDRPRRNR